MDLDLDEVWLLRAFPCNVASGRGDTRLHRAAANGNAAVVELLLAANAPVDVKNEDGRGPQFGRDATRSGPSWRVTVYLEIGIHRSLQQKVILLRQVSTSSVSRSEFFVLYKLFEYLIG